MAKFNPKLTIAFLFLLLQACAQPSETPFQSGDLIFCNYAGGTLSSAIDEVTQTAKQTHYAHMGLISIENDTVFVLHATTQRGVVKESWADFMQQEEPAKVDLYRLKDTLRYAIPEAIQQAKQLVGLPYNDHYYPSDTCYYCSQLIYEIFKADHIFQLEPMTFKNPETGTFSPDWVQYYQGLDLDIPEGKPGCNPNGLAASKNLRFIQNLNLH